MADMEHQVSMYLRLKRRKEVVSCKDELGVMKKMFRNMDPKTAKFESVVQNFNRKVRKMDSPVKLNGNVIGQLKKMEKGYFKKPTNFF